MNTFFFFLPFLLAYIIVVVYAERKLSAFVQDRLGPMETGKYGLLQTFADLLKTLQKENLIPYGANQWLHQASPVAIFVSVFTGFSVLPLSAQWPGLPISSGLFFLFSIIPIHIIGIFMAGWSSNSKYSVLGSIRSALQMLSYEVPLSLAALCVAFFTGSIDLYEISQLQSGNGFWYWNFFQSPWMPPAFILFFIATLAESNRAPFDFPEAESELVAGFQVEYSGFPWAIIVLSEYAMMLLMSLVGVVLFWGSYHSPLPNFGGMALRDWTTGQAPYAIHAWGVVWLTFKTCWLVSLQIIVRWIFPRTRLDQMIKICWQYLTPIGIAILLCVACCKAF